MRTRTPEPFSTSLSTRTFVLPPFLAEMRDRFQDARSAGALLVQAGDEGFARAPSNIALLKYWGKNPDAGEQIPVGPSMSRALDGFCSVTRVRALTRMRSVEHRGLPVVEAAHEFELRDEAGGVLASGVPPKMENFLRRVLAGWADDVAVRVDSINNFPTGCGVASSASGYAALAGALSDLFGLREFMSPDDHQVWLCEWARLGSGSATRSALLAAQAGAFVAWELEPSGTSTRTVLEESHEIWSEFEHLLAVLSAEPKEISSSLGHTRAHLSPFQGIRVAGLPARFREIKRAVREGDFPTVCRISEEDALLMHAVMATGQPPVVYMTKACQELIAAFVGLREASGLRALWTLDAGPNVHFLVHQAESARLESWLASQPGVLRVLSGDGGARALSSHAKVSPSVNLSGLVLGPEVWSHEGRETVDVTAHKS